MKVADVITNRILDKLNEGTVPWQRSWSGSEWPKNLVSKKEYRGVNHLMLSCAGFGSPYWVTFKQCSDMGGTIKKGEHGWPVLFYTWLNDKSDVENERKIPFMRFYKVWNVDQTEGIEADKIPALMPRNENERMDLCEGVIANMKLRPEIKHMEARAYYSPKLDYVNMPKLETFDKSESYYSVLFHELTHSTGHSSRLARKDFNESGFGSESYSKEELVAELGAAFLCGHCGIDNKTIDQSASYIQSWIKRLKNDKTLIISASGLAQKSTDYILGKATWEE